MTNTKEQASATLVTLKRYIYDNKGNITPQMKQCLIDIAAHAYEAKGTKSPRTCGHDFITGTIAHCKSFSH